MSSYTQVLDAIEAYYGRNDIWKSMYEWTGDRATAQELAKAVEQVPGVRTVRSVSGKIQYFEYVGEEYTQHVISDLAAQSVNSNVNVATTAPSAGGGGVATKVKTPVQMNTAGGAVTGMKSGLAQAGKFTMNEVLPAIAAAGVGISLGKWIDSALYNANPDFWDSQGMSTLSPETWDSITSGDDSLSSRVFNMVFGLNGDKTQPYIDQNALAYLTGYMIQQGVFTPSETSADWTNIEADIQTQGLANPLSLSVPPTFYFTDGARSYSFSTNEPAQFVVLESTYQYYIFAVSTTSFTGTITQSTGTTNSFDGSAISYNGITYYVAFEQYYKPAYPMIIGTSSPFDGTVNTRTRWDVAHIVLAGTIIGGGGVDGITDQENSTIFDASNISDPSDIPNILSALQTQFPDLFTDSISNTVIDPETGEEVTTTYLPVGYPQVDPENPTQPIANISTQTDTAYDPDEYPDISDAIAQLIQYITDTAGETPTMQPDDVTNPNPPDTGNGNTPVVTPLAGSATALWSIYNPTQVQIDAFGAWLWSNDFVDQLKKIFNDPMESIISLHKVFCTPSTGGAQNIAVGYLNSGVSSKVVTAQYTDVDCGSIQLSEYFGNVYDYKDTSVELYLPFIGIVPLSVSDVMRASIHVLYHIDVLTGACLADVEVTRDAGAGGVLYQYSGDCAVHYPVSSGSYIGIVGGILSAGAGIAGTIASGGAAAPLLLGGASALMRMHTDVARSGGFSANAGAMGAKVPYLIINRPQTALPENYLDIEGIGSNKTVTLNTCAGYTRIKEVYLQGIGDATEGELNELETLLKAGVIFPITETQPNE